MAHFSPYIFTRTEKPELKFKACKRMGIIGVVEAIFMDQGFEIDGAFYKGGQYLLWRNEQLTNLPEKDFITHYVWI